jgi:hypothetical protein
MVVNRVTFNRGQVAPVNFPTDEGNIENYVDLAIAIVKEEMRDYYNALRYEEKLWKKIKDAEFRVQKTRSELMRSELAPWLNVEPSVMVKTIDTAVANGQRLFRETVKEKPDKQK